MDEVVSGSVIDVETHDLREQTKKCFMRAFVYDLFAGSGDLERMQWRVCAHAFLTRKEKHMH